MGNRARLACTLNLQAQIRVGVVGAPLPWTLVAGESYEAALGARVVDEERADRPHGRLRVRLHPSPEVPMERTWKQLSARMHELETLEGVVGLLQWDQQTVMPAKGGGSRGEQVALLSRLSHELLTAPEVGEWVDALADADLSPVQSAGLRNLSRDRARAVRVPPDLVGRLAQAQTEGFEAWIRAKEAADFQQFAPALGELVELTAERCRAIDGDRPVYDVLLDEYDPGTTTASLRDMFGRLRGGLVELIGAVGDRTQPPVDAALPVGAQLRLQEQVAGLIGFDLEAGRLDESEHPFTVGVGPGDVRITTHVHERDLLRGLSGAIHEAGHGMYEQGLPPELRPTGAGHAASMGLHESQSRFWENFIGRSQAFFGWLEPRLAEYFPGAGLRADDLYRAANRIEPGLIRVAADEVTYNLHIIVRFELELALFEGMPLEELPGAWRDRYREFLGIEPGDDAVGVLQDLHWASGAFGYFPSYTLGNLYAAGLGDALLRDVPDLWDRVGAGDFATVRSWLRTRVHARAHTAEAPEIVSDVTGEVDLVDSLLAYLWGRHGALYGLQR